jgi:hypothetical protein
MRNQRQQKFWQIWFVREQEVFILARLKSWTFLDACRTFCAGSDRWNEAEKTIDGLKVYPSEEAAKRGPSGLVF